MGVGKNGEDDVNEKMYGKGMTGMGNVGGGRREEN